MRSRSRGRIQRKTWCMGPYAGADYNLTVCPLQSRLQHIYHGQPNARVDLNPMPGSILTLCQGRLYPPVRDLALSPTQDLASAQLQAHWLEGYSMFFFAARWVCCLIAWAPRWACRTGTSSTAWCSSRQPRRSSQSGLTLFRIGKEKI